MFLSDEMLAEIGRVTVAASLLDFLAAEMVILRYATLPSGDYSALNLMAHPGHVLRDTARAAVNANSPDRFKVRAIEWIDKATRLMAQRDHLVHTLWLADQLGDEIRRAIATHPRTHPGVELTLDAMHQSRLELEAHGANGIEVLKELSMNSATLS